MTDQEKLLECKDAITAVFGAMGFDHKRSEEHTSELQSH